MSDPDRYPPIGSYAVVGDCRTAALVSRNGSIDWLCLPRFDSPSLFAGLLDRDRGGSFAVRPSVTCEVERRYVDETNVLETTFRTGEGGVVRLTDLMPVTSEAAKRRDLRPEHQILRRVECLAGEVPVEVVFDPRPDDGRSVPTMDDRGALGWICARSGTALALRSEIDVEPRGGAAGLGGVETLTAGDSRLVSMAYAHEEPLVLPEFGETAGRRIEETLAWWQEWSGSLEYEGEYREPVVRSALAVKLLTYAPSGAIVAAPTTSLPEWIGGVRNWDYRYCWLRDASLTIQALLDLSAPREAEAFLSWILHSTRRSWPELEIVYDVHGRRCPPERELDHLEGYRGSKPVRVGNGARGQLQLDIYGEVADAVHEWVERGGGLDRSTERLLEGMGKTVCRMWRESDEGIWEIRSGRRHHTYSKAMCWIALDRLLALHRQGHVRKLDGEGLARTRDEIRHEVETRGFDEELGSYVATFDGNDIDASLLLLGRYGFEEPESERMIGTCARVHERLGENGLLYRYRPDDGSDDGLPEGEGTFGIASFWAIDCLCRQGLHEKARERFEHILGFANDVGLYAEEIDPHTGEQLGNFPQAFTHVGLIDAALTLEERCGGPARRRRAAERKGFPVGDEVAV